MLGQRYEAAFAHAAALHRHQTRKGKETPYLGHLLGVSALVIENGGGEDQAIAALLHDAVEDAGGAVQLAEIEVHFGEAVGRIVADCTDFNGETRPPWRARKEAYVTALADKPAASLFVSLCDKTHNAEAILDDLSVHGPALWDRFTGGRDGVLWYYDALAGAFERALPGALSRRLRRAVDGMRAIG